MGHLNTGLARLFLECALYLASLSNPNQVVRIVHSQNPIDPDTISQFFYDRIVSTTRGLAHHTQESLDDSLLFVHFALCKIYSDPNRNLTTSLASKNGRDQFEKEFCALVNGKIIGNDTVVNLIGQLTTVLRKEAESSGSDIFYKIANDLIEPANEADNESFLNEASFWRFRKQITIKSFIGGFKTFIQNRTNDQQRGYSLLDRFLDQLDKLKVLSILN